MRRLNILTISILALSIGVSSCAKMGDLAFHVDKPSSYLNQEIINQYAPLKDYIDRTANPDFKFGAGAGLQDYVSKSVMYRMLNDNFDEITMGWEMKHMVVVNAQGDLMLENVSRLLEASRASGMSIFGHTLCWHANQNANYLNHLITPQIILGDGEPSWNELIANGNLEGGDLSEFHTTATLDGGEVTLTADGQGEDGTGRAILVSNPTALENDWQNQFFVSFSPEVEAGETYEFSFSVRADHDAGISTQAHKQPGEYMHWDMLGFIDVTTSWTTFTKSVTISENEATAGAIAFNLGATATNYYFDNISFKKEIPAASLSWIELLSNNNVEGEDFSNFHTSVTMAGGSLSFTSDGEGAGGTGRAIKVENPTALPDEWANQFYISFPPAAQEGETYKLTMDIRADHDASAGTQAQTAPQQYIHRDMFGIIPFSTTWTTFTRTIVITPEIANAGAIAINLGITATNYYFDNISLQKETAGMEYSPEEKFDLVYGALEKWISEMVTHCKDDVRAWDVVNEPMSDWPDVYQLKTGVGRTDLTEDEFFWQDYLGYDYAVYAFKLARQHGNDDDIHFINDYGLEYNLDKCKGLIQYMNHIENQGGRVDGIGTQMHIGLEIDRENIIESFKLLAATGKLIKVSELDIGLGPNTTNATPELLQQQSDLYRFVVEAYMEHIPAAQRYGITLWSPTDSPENSSWRPGEPIGIWDLNLTRKPAYKGMADGLAGEEVIQSQHN